MTLLDLLSPRDLIIGPVVVAVLFKLLSGWTRHSADRTILLRALAFKLALALTFVLMTIFVFRSGDTLLYHDAALAILTGWRGGIPDPVVMGICGELSLSELAQSTQYMCYLSAVIHALVASSYLGATFVIAFAGFCGQLLIYRAFSRQYPQRELRLWWILGVLFMPSVTFWSAALLKEPLRMLGLGLVLWGALGLTSGYRYRPAGALLLGEGILVLFAPDLARGSLAGVLPLLLLRRRMWLSLVRWRWLVGPALIVLLAVAGGTVGATIENLPQRVFNASGYYDLVEGARVLPPLITEPSWPALLLAVPKALILALFRPFPWEVSGVIAVLSLVENAVLFYLLCRAAVKIRQVPEAFRDAWSSPLFVSCAALVLVLGLAIGASTPNFGTLSRYRMPLVPAHIAVVGLFTFHAEQRLAARRLQDTAFQRQRRLEWAIGVDL